MCPLATMYVLWYGKWLRLLYSFGTSFMSMSMRWVGVTRIYAGTIIYAYFEVLCDGFRKLWKSNPYPIDSFSCDGRDICSYVTMCMCFHLVFVYGCLD